MVEMRDLPYSDCYHRSIACSRRGSPGDAVLRFFKIAINPRIGIKKEQPSLFLFWWRCGVCLTAIVTVGQSRAAEGVHTATPCCDFSKSQ